MKLLKRMALLSLCVLTLSGCTQSSVSDAEIMAAGPGGAALVEESVPTEKEPLVEEDAEPETMFDWEQVSADANDMFNDPDYYPQGVEMTFEGNEGTKEVKLMWVLKDGTTEEEAMEYATELVQKFNDILATQSADFEFASMDSFGTVWEQFALVVQVSAEDGTMLIDKAYKAGDAIDLELPEYGEGGPQAGAVESVSPADKK